MRKFAFLLLVAVVVFISLGTTSSEDAQTTTYYVNVTSGYLNVRFGPSTNEDSFAKLHRGDKVDVISVTNGWAYIVYGDSLGYVSANYLSEKKPSPTPRVQQSHKNSEMKDLKVQYVGVLEKKVYAYDSKNNKRSIPAGYISIFYFEKGWAWIPFNRQILRIKENSIAQILEVKDVNTDICEEPIICAYTTFFPTNEEYANRINNLYIGASYLNIRLAPNETFSFNKALGERSPKKGYLEAGAFSNGQTIQAYGGGVCQLSSTIFAAIRQLNFLVTERYAHNPEVTYLPLEMDATVNWKSLDLKFSNPYDFTVQIEPYIAKGMLTIIVRKVIPESY